MKFFFNFFKFNLNFILYRNENNSIIKIDWKRLYSSMKIEYRTINNEKERIPENINNNPYEFFNNKFIF